MATLIDEFKDHEGWIGCLDLCDDLTKPKPVLCLFPLCFSFQTQLTWGAGGGRRRRPSPASSSKRAPPSRGRLNEPPAPVLEKELERNEMAETHSGGARRRWLVDIARWCPSPAQFQAAAALLPPHHHPAIARFVREEDRNERSSAGCSSTRLCTMFLAFRSTK
ncbi:hypothetical protein ACQ4PT_038539 [Festuca glaucescens]